MGLSAEVGAVDAGWTMGMGSIKHWEGEGGMDAGRRVAAKVVWRGGGVLSGVTGWICRGSGGKVGGWERRRRGENGEDLEGVR